MPHRQEYVSNEGITCKRYSTGNGVPSRCCDSVWTHSCIAEWAKEHLWLAESKVNHLNVHKLYYRDWSYELIRTILRSVLSCVLLIVN